MSFATFLKNGDDWEETHDLEQQAVLQQAVELVVRLGYQRLEVKIEYTEDGGTIHSILSKPLDSETQDSILAAMEAMEAREENAKEN